MKNTNTIKIILISLITLVVLSLVGYSYAYFSLEIDGKPKEITMSTGDLRLIYKDETELKLVDAMPGDEVSKVITVKNIGTKKATYSLYWGNLINTIYYYELHVTLECKSYINYGETNQIESGTCDRIYKAVPISDTITSGYIKKGISIEPGITQEYTVTVKFDNKTYPQDDNLDKTFTGKIGIEEYTEPAEIYCTFDGELTQGAEYVNGQYTYRYKQEGFYEVVVGSLNHNNESDVLLLSTKNYNIKKLSLSDNNWINIDDDGWGVQLTDRESTDDVTSKLCTYINGKPVVSMSSMFADSQAKNIDLSSFNTSSVTNMNQMFLGTVATTLDLSSFDTSKVTDMGRMFQYSDTMLLDLSSFDTSNVTDMDSMFESAYVVSIMGLTNFNTLNITDMSYMFYDSNIRELNLSSFDTSNVINMERMFNETEALSIDLSSFDTSKVTNMGSMFSDSQAITLNVSSFDTSNVTNMCSMFNNSAATEIIGLDKFNTLNVTDMRSMFSYTQASKLDVGNFDTSNVTSMKNMFYYSNATTIDLSNFDTSKVTDMNSMFKYSTIATIYASDKFIIDKVTNSESMFYGAYKLVGGAGTVYNSSNVDKTYARVDGGTSSPGYFTLKTN